jgi:hypothetical protein
MLAPTNSGPSDEVHTSHKRKAPLDDNGNPVNMNFQKKKTSSGSTMQAPPKKKPVPEKPVPAKRRPSIDPEEVPDDSVSLPQSKVPCNP